MADEGEKVLEVLLNKKYLFMVLISHSKSIAELRAEVERVAREEFGEIRVGHVTVLQNKQGARLPDRYKVGKLLQNESRILAYSSDYKIPVSIERKRKRSCLTDSEPVTVDHKAKRKRKRKKLSEERLNGAGNVGRNLVDSELFGGCHCQDNKTKGKSCNAGFYDINTRQTRSTTRGPSRLCKNVCNILEENLRDIKVIGKSVSGDCDNFASNNDGDDGHDDRNGDGRCIINGNNSEHFESNVENEKTSTVLSENSTDSDEHTQSADGQSEFISGNTDTVVEEIKRKLCFRRQNKDGTSCNEKPSLSCTTTKRKSRKGKENITKKRRCGKKSFSENGNKKEKARKRLKIRQHNEDSESDKTLEANSLSNSEKRSSDTISLSDYEGSVMQRVCKNTKSKVHHMSSAEKHLDQNVSRKTTKQHLVISKCGKVKANDKKRSQGKTRASQAKRKAKQVENSTELSRETPRSSEEKGKRNQIKKSAKLSRDKPRSSRTKGEGKHIKENTVPEQENDFLRTFLVDMRELQSESRHDEGSSERCLNGTMERRGYTERCAILSTSKFKSLFRMPEHCRPRRKEAIVKSATKVADWLSTHDVSSNVNDVTETCNTELDNEVSSMRRVKQTTECATRSDGNCYNDENDDSDECDDDDDDDADDADDNDDNGDESEGVDSLSGDSDSRKINNTNFRASLSQPHSKGKAVEAQKCSSINAQEQEQLPSPLSSPVKNDIYCLTSKKLLRCSTGAVLADTTQTCLVKIPKLPVCSQNGKVFLKTTPLKIMPLHEHVASCAKNVDGGGQSRKKGDDKTMERTDNPVSVRRNCELQKTKDTELEKEHEEIQGFPNMQELQSKSRHDEDSTERCLNSTMERRGSADSGAILSTSKFESLFSMAEHCRPRRKEAIVKSATKVADWLSTHDVSSNVIDVTETCNTGLDNEASLKRVIGTIKTSTRRVKQTTECVTRSDDNDYNDENDECNDNDADDDDDSLSGDSDRRKINNTNLRASLRQPHSKGKAFLADMTQTCLVKIPKLPVCSHKGKVILKSTPLKIMPLHEHVASCAKKVDDGGQGIEKEGDKTMERTDNPVSVRRNYELQKTKDTELEKENAETQEKHEGVKGTVDSSRIMGTEGTGNGIVDSQTLTLQTPNDRRVVHSLVAQEREENLKDTQSQITGSVAVSQGINGLENDEEDVVSLSSSSSIETEDDSEFCYRIVLPNSCAAVGTRAGGKNNRDRSHAAKGTSRRGATSKKRGRHGQSGVVDNLTEDSASKMKKLPSEMREGLERSKDEQFDEASEGRTESATEIAAAEDISEIKGQISNNDKSRCELKGSSKSPRNPEYDVRASVDEVCQDKKEIEDEGTTKESSSESRQSRKDKLPSSTQEAVESSKNRNDVLLDRGQDNAEVEETPETTGNSSKHENRNAEKGKSKSTVCENADLSVNRDRLDVKLVRSEDEERTDAVSKSSKRHKSHSTCQDIPEMLQDVNSVVVVQEQQTEPAVTASESPWKNKKSKKGHLHDNKNSSESTMESVDVLGSDKKKLNGFNNTEPLQDYNSVVVVQEQQTDPAVTASESPLKNGKSKKDTLRGNRKCSTSNMESVYGLGSEKGKLNDSNNTELLQDISCVVPVEEQQTECDVTVSENPRKGAKSKKGLLRDNKNNVTSYMESVDRLSSGNEKLKHSNNTEPLQDVNSAVVVQEQQIKSAVTTSESPRKNGKSRKGHLHDNKNSSKSTMESVDGLGSEKGKCSDSNNTKLLQDINSAVPVEEQQTESDVTPIESAQKGGKSKKGHLHNDKNSSKSTMESVERLGSEKRKFNDSNDTEPLQDINSAVVVQAQQIEYAVMASESTRKCGKSKKDHLHDNKSSSKSTMESVDGLDGDKETKHLNASPVKSKSLAKDKVLMEGSHVELLTAKESVLNSVGESCASKEESESAPNKDELSDKSTSTSPSKHKDSKDQSKERSQTKSVDEVNSDTESDDLSSVTDKEREGDEELTLKLTPIREGKQIVWMKEITRNEDTEQEGLNNADGIKRLDISSYESPTHLDERKQSETENTAVVSSETQVKTTESKGEIKASFVETGMESGRNTSKEKKICEDHSNKLNEKTNEKIKCTSSGNGSDETMNGSGELQCNIIKQDRGKTKTLKRKAAHEENSTFQENMENHASIDEGVKKRKKKKSKDSSSEAKQKEDNRKSSDREIVGNRVEGMDSTNGQVEEGNNLNKIENEKKIKKKKKEKRRKSESSISLNDSGYKTLSEERDKTEESDVSRKNKAVKKNDKSSPDSEQDKRWRSSPLKLTPIREGKQIVWMKEITRKEDTEQEGLDNAGGIKRLDMLRCESATHSDERKQSETENTAVVSSETQVKTTESKGEIKASFVETGMESRRNTSKEKRICEDHSNKLNEKVKCTSFGSESDEAMNGSGEHEFEGNVIKQDREKTKTLKRKAAHEENSTVQEDMENHASIDEGAKKRKKKKSKDSSSKAKQKGDDRKSSDRELVGNRVEGIDSTSGQVEEGNDLNKMENEKKRKKKEKKRKSESPTSLNDSGYKILSEEKDKTEKSDVSRKNKAVKKDEKSSPDSGVVAMNSKPSSEHSQLKKKSKPLSSLLDLALDDSAEHRSNTIANHKTPTSPSKQVHKLMQQLRQTPKGFCHTVMNRKLSASTSTIHVRRKPRTNPRENRRLNDMTAKERELVTNDVSFEQLLDDDSFWDT